MTNTMQLLQDYATSGDNLWLLHKLQELQVEIDDLEMETIRRVW